MKNVFKTIKKGAVLASILTCSFSFANEISNSIITTDAKSTAFTLNHVKQGDLIAIKDTNGVTLFKELITATGTYRKGFDLSELPSGNYFFEIDKDLEIKIIPFTLNSNTVVFNKENEVTKFKPVFNQKNDLVFLSKFSPNRNPVKIKIYAVKHNEQTILHSEVVEGVTVVERVFKLKKGNYKIVINSDNKEYTKFINN